MKVALFVTCLVDQLYPQVGLATVELLERLGVEVRYDPRQTCCGQPAHNSGFAADAARVARHFLEVFAEDEWVVAPSGSCATMVRKLMPSLFEDVPDLHERAKAVGARTWELSDFLVNVLQVRETGAFFPHRVTFHDSCHLLRELGVFEQPRALLRSVRGLDFVEMQDSTRCCGFGGTFAVKFAPVSAAIGQDKIDAILGTGARYVVANDVSCLMHLDGLLRRQRLPVETMHLAELLVQRQ
jgi:L-lactate dehydrogenase complex protein LldE